MRHLWVILVPSFVVGCAMVLRLSSGPYWIGINLDPEYAYLMNSLSLTQGLPVGLSEHPGSTLQWAGAIWLYSINVLLGKDELVTDVLTRPEFYLAHMHMILLGILFFTLVMAGWLTFRWTGDRVAALLMQVGIVISYTARHALSRMSPEPLLLILGLWLAITVLYHHHQVQQGSKKEPFWQYGLITGMGMGLKLTFLPLAFLPLVLLKRFRDLLFYLGISGIVFLTLAANPLMNFTKLIKFTINSLVAREGYNRPMEAGSTKFQAMLDGFSLLEVNSWRLEKPLFLLVLIFVTYGLLVLLVKPYREKNNNTIWNVRLWIGLLLTLSGQIFLVANGPRADLRYLCPVLGLIGLQALLCWRWIDGPPIPLLKAFTWGKTTYLVVMVVLIGLTMLKLPGEYELAAAQTKNWQEANRFKTDNRLLTKATVYYYRCSSIQYALSFGHDWAQRPFSQQLSTLYPNFYDFHRWSQQLYSNFGAKHVTLDEAVNLAETVLIQGQILDPINIPSLERTDYHINASAQLINPSTHVIPTNLPHELSAEVIFRGTVEWIVLLKSQPQESETTGINEQPKSGEGKQITNSESK